MKNKVFVFDPTASDKKSAVRGVGRYLQILKENFPEWTFTNKLANSLTRNSQTIFINPFFNFLQPPLTIRRIAQKQIAVIHDLIPLKYPKYFPVGIKGKLNIFLNKLALKNYDLIITDSEASKKDIIQILGIDEKKVKVIYPCLPKIFNQEARSKKQEERKKILNTKYLILDTPFCLYVGDATWNKNLVNLAKAIKIINVTCVFVGKVFERIKEQEIKKLRNKVIKEKVNPNYLISQLLNYSITQSPNYSHPWQKELREFFNETKNDKRFIFLGFIPDEELIKLYQQARCNILVSRDEGFGFSYLEAASQKCPSVLSDIQVMHEISGDNALFAGYDDPSDIANAIGEFYWNPKKRESIGLKAFNQCKKYSSKNFKKSFLKTIENL